VPTAKTEKSPKDLQSRYRSELALLDRRKDQRRQQHADKRKLQSIPKIASYLKTLKPFLRPVSKAPRPISPIRGSSSSFTVNQERPALPPRPDPESAVGKGLSVIEGLERKEKETEVLITQSIEKLAQMEVEATSRGIELPPRQSSDDAVITEEAVAGPKAAKSEEQESETTATNGAKELDPVDEANTDPEIPDELVRESAEEWDWDNERTYLAGHSKSDAALILNRSRTTLYKRIKEGAIKLTPLERISISEIKRVITEKKRNESVQA